jgi:hypothetical protein
MKDDQKTDQLLNGFIDGELSQREQTEVKRLIAHDAEAAKRLKELQKCRLLVGSLPASKAPDGILAGVKAALDKDVRTQKVQPGQRIVGTIQLLLRKSFAAAAMFLLVAGLLVIIYKVVSPPPRPGPKIVQHIPSQDSGDIRKFFTDVAPDKTTVSSDGEAAQADSGVTFRLVLKTSKAPAVQAELGRVLEKFVASDFAALPGQADKVIYIISSSSDKITAMLSDFDNTLDESASTALYVDTGKTGKAIVVDNIGMRQLADITSQQNPERQIKAATYFSIINNINKLTPDSRYAVASAVSKPTEIPKPVLTKDEQAASSALQESPVIHLTIELVSE